MLSYTSLHSLKSAAPPFLYKLKNTCWHDNWLETQLIHFRYLCPKFTSHVFSIYHKVSEDATCFNIYSCTVRKTMEAYSLTKGATQMHNSLHYGDIFFINKQKLGRRKVLKILGSQQGFKHSLKTKSHSWGLIFKIQNEIFKSQILWYFFMFFNRHKCRQVLLP